MPAEKRRQPAADLDVRRFDGTNIDEITEFMGRQPQIVIKVQVGKPGEDGPWREVQPGWGVVLDSGGSYGVRSGDLLDSWEEFPPA